MVLSGVTSKAEPTPVRKPTSTPAAQGSAAKTKKSEKKITPAALHARSEKNRPETDVDINPSIKHLQNTGTRMRGLPTQGQRKASSTKPQSPTPADQTPSSSSQTRSSNASKSSSKKPKATPQETHKAVAKVREQLEANKDTGWLGNKWNSVKETIGSSPDPEKSWVTPKNLWAKVFNYDHSYEANEEKVAKLEARLAENPDAKIDAEELKAAKESIDTFAEAQVNAVDTITDIGLGVAVAAAVLAAVPTGGASLGFVAGAALIATPTSAAVKVAIKATNDWSAGDEYSRNELIYDALSGAAIGAAGALTFGAVSAVANRFVTKGITNKAVQFVAKEMAEGSVDGSVTGAISETARARYLKGQSWGQALSSGAQGALVGGSIGAVFQTGLSGAGEGAGTALRSLPVAGAVNVASEVADNLDDTLVDAVGDSAEEMIENLAEAATTAAEEAATGLFGEIRTTIKEKINNLPEIEGISPKPIQWAKHATNGRLLNVKSSSPLSRSEREILFPQAKYNWGTSRQGVYDSCVLDASYTELMRHKETQELLARKILITPDKDFLVVSIHDSTNIPILVPKDIKGQYGNTGDPALAILEQGLPAQDSLAALNLLKI